MESKQQPPIAKSISIHSEDFQEQDHLVHTADSVHLDLIEEEQSLSVDLESKQQLSIAESMSVHGEKFQKKDHQDCQQTAKSLYQIVDKQPCVETNFEKDRNLELETKELQKKFSALISKTIASFREKKVTLQDLDTYLLHIRAVKPVLTKVDEFLLFSPKCLEQIERYCEKPAQVLEKLKGYYSWFDFELIEGIINAFSDEGNDLRLSLEKYKHDLLKYCQNRLCELKIESDDKNLMSEQLTKIVFKVDMEWAQIRFSDIKQITAKIREILALTEGVLILRSIRSGCIELKYSIPKHVVGALVPIEAAAFEKHGIRYFGK